MIAMPPDPIECLRDVMTKWHQADLTAGPTVSDALGIVDITLTSCQLLFDSTALPLQGGSSGCGTGAIVRPYPV
jgi:hypothetical protein